MEKNKIKDNLIKEVQALAKELGRTPKQEEFIKSQDAICEFGHWNSFTEAAKLIPFEPPNLSLEDYERYIHEYVKENDRTPTRQNFDEDMYLPHARYVEKKFNASWSQILVNLGYDPNIRMFTLRDATDEELLKIVTSEIIRIGSTKVSDYKDKRGTNTPSDTYVTRKLKMQWTEMLEVLGFEPNKEYKNIEERLEELVTISKELGRTPSMHDLDSHGLSGTIYKHYFGSYNNALKEVGLEPNPAPIRINETDEELLEMYVKFSEKIGKVPEGASGYDLDQSDEIYDSGIFTTRFGGIPELRSKAGFESRKHKRKYTKNMIANILKNEYIDKGRKITIPEIRVLSKNDETFPSVATILRHFKTTKISEVWKEIEEEYRDEI